MTYAHVICCNDGIEKVFLSDEARAQQRCAAMRDADYHKRFPEGGDYEEYCRTYYWHIHTVELIRDAL